MALKGLSDANGCVGESWEISGLPGDESVVESGPDEGLTIGQLIDKYDSELLGERIYRKYGTRFPLLVKIIDAKSDLSVQVHPDDRIAAARGHESGKNEMWFVAEAVKGARIANGFKHPVDPADYDTMVESGHIENVLNYIEIEAGEIYYIPSGRVHAICGGCLIIEIQQSADITYRIFDYNRRDSAGKKRELHTDLAREAINFNDTSGEKIDYKQRLNIPVNVVKTPYFCTNLLKADTEMIRDYSESDSFVIMVCIEGEAEISSREKKVTLSGGQSVLIPAASPGISIIPRGTVSLLETYIS